jgi:hypothetical protein
MPNREPKPSTVFFNQDLLFVTMSARLATYRPNRSLQGSRQVLPCRRFRNIEQSASFGIQQDDFFAARLEYRHAAGRSLQYLSQQNAHTLAFGDTGGKGTIALLQLAS